MSADSLVHESRLVRQHQADMAVRAPLFAAWPMPPWWEDGDARQRVPTTLWQAGAGEVEKCAFLPLTTT